MDILRFITAGSVDDGKSTLIGRLLYDSKSILTDQLEAIEKSSKTRGNGEIDLALLTDGLRAEREQGITIDVAYKYFATAKRKFIIADAPGHIQYTRNMITGASNVSLTIILIDARTGLVEQTKRHSIIASLLGIKHVLVAINKIDLVGYNEQVYHSIVSAYQQMADQLGIQSINYIPISALNGDNFIQSSPNTPWYQGKALLPFLEEVEIDDTINLTNGRFQVQYIIRPQTAELPDYRGYAGKIISGIYKKGQQVNILPSGASTTIRKIELAGEEVESAFAPQSVTLLLDTDIDISRGDSIIPADETPQISNEITVLLCWLDEKPLQPFNKYILQHNNKRVLASIKEILYKLDVNSLTEEPTATIQLNDVVKVKIKTAERLVFDSYKQLQGTGAAILIDETSNNTVAAIMIQ
ncbi:MAG: sulfate adenylyltransferase [Sphingobacteriia bacterium]|nr:MAG: sulfate adenylyltransferase [Sphingobacteriia bacterium]